MIKLTVANFRKRFRQIGLALTERELEALLSLLKVQVVEASEALIVEGTETDALYFVWEGELDVVMTAPQGEYTVATVERGALLGEISLLSPGKTTATVRSERGCIALHLDVQSLEAFWEEYPHAASIFLKEISQLVSKRIRAANKILQSLQHTQGHNTETIINAQNVLLEGKVS